MRRFSNVFLSIGFRLSESRESAPIINRTVHRTVGNVACNFFPQTLVEAATPPNPTQAAQGHPEYPQHHPAAQDHPPPNLTPSSSEPSSTPSITENLRTIHHPSSPQQLRTLAFSVSHIFLSISVLSPYGHQDQIVNNGRGISVCLSHAVSTDILLCGLHFELQRPSNMDGWKHQCCWQIKMMISENPGLTSLIFHCMYDRK